MDVCHYSPTVRKFLRIFNTIISIICVIAFVYGINLLWNASPSKFLAIFYLIFSSAYNKPFLFIALGISIGMIAALGWHIVAKRAGRYLPWYAGLKLALFIIEVIAIMRTCFKNDNTSLYIAYGIIIAEALGFVVAGLTAKFVKAW